MMSFFIAEYDIIMRSCLDTALVMLYRIAGNFREVQIFVIFATHNQNAKI